MDKADKTWLAEGIKGTQDELHALSNHLMAHQNELVGGSSRGVLIPFLMWLNKEVGPIVDWKLCFFVLVVTSSIIVSWLSIWITPFVVFVGGFFATMASYKKLERPAGIPLAKNKLDVLMGRSIQVSTVDRLLHANNNVSITSFKGKYIAAYRQSEYHLPSELSRIIVSSSVDLSTWTTEWTYSNGKDLRETILFEMGGKLFLYFLSLVPVHKTFKPLSVFYITSTDAKHWTEPKQVCCRGEVAWEIKVYGDKAYKASYLGDHYGTDDVLTLFEESSDGINWKPVGNNTSSAVYRGGICEVSFEFTKAGDLVAIGRNEDGDSTGFGSQLFYARKDNLGKWVPLKISVPWRFDSPRMTCTASGEILLFARYAPYSYQFAPSWLPFAYQKTINLVLYSIRGPKSAAIFRIAPAEEWGSEGHGAVQLIRCFENSFGDCGFFSVTPERNFLQAPALAPERTEPDADCWVVANYASTTCHSHAPWFYGQMRPTHIYVCRCRAVHGQL